VSAVRDQIKRESMVRYAARYGIPAERIDRVLEQLNRPPPFQEVEIAASKLAVRILMGADQ
jgi:hypothetical protein